MEEVRLTSDEIVYYLMDKINNDSEFIDKFPRVIDATYWFPELPMEFKNLSRQEQFDEIYLYFKYLLSQYTDDTYTNIPQGIRLRKFLPLSSMSEIVKSLRDKSFDSLTKTEKETYWVYDNIKSAVLRTRRITLEAYEPKKPFDLSQHCIEFTPYPYEKELEKSFYNQISNYPIKYTNEIIESLRTKVDKAVQKEVLKIKTSKFPIEKLLEQKYTISCQQIDKLSCWEEYDNANRPTLKEINAVAGLHKEQDFALLIELLMMMEKLESEYVQNKFPLSEIKRLEAKEKKIKDNDSKVKSKIELEIDKWIEDCLAGCLKPSDILFIKDYVKDFYDCNGESIPEMRPMKPHKLKGTDLSSFIWVIGFLYNTIQLYISNNRLAEFLKALFPSVFENVEIRTITKHIKSDRGSVIKIPKEYNKDNY